MESAWQVIRPNKVLNYKKICNENANLIFARFADFHPGGERWISANQGTDITELFESHHVDIKRARILLEKYYIRKADGERNSKYTFHENGFYSTLRMAIFDTWKANKPRITKQLWDLFSTTSYSTNLITNYDCVFSFLIRISRKLRP